MSLASFFFVVVAHSVFRCWLFVHFSCVLDIYGSFQVFGICISRLTWSNGQMAHLSEFNPVNNCKGLRQLFICSYCKRGKLLFGSSFACECSHSEISGNTIRAVGTLFAQTVFSKNHNFSLVIFRRESTVHSTIDIYDAMALVGVTF